MSIGHVRFAGSNPDPLPAPVTPQEQDAEAAGAWRPGVADKLRGIRERDDRYDSRYSEADGFNMTGFFSTLGALATTPAAGFGVYALTWKLGDGKAVPLAIAAAVVGATIPRAAFAAYDRWPEITADDDWSPRPLATRTEASELPFSMEKAAGSKIAVLSAPGSEDISRSLHLGDSYKVVPDRQAGIEEAIERVEGGDSNAVVIKTATEGWVVTSATWKNAPTTPERMGELVLFATDPAVGAIVDEGGVYVRGHEE